jgi:hypothetical protein
MSCRKLSATATSVPPKKGALSGPPSKEAPNEIHAPGAPQASMLQKVLFGKKSTKQTTLRFKKVSTEQYKEENLRAFEAVRKNAKSMQQRAACEKQSRDEKRREHGAERSRRFYWKTRGGKPDTSESAGEESITSEMGGKTKKNIRKLVCTDRPGGVCEDAPDIQTQMPNTTDSTAAQEFQASLAANSRPEGVAWRAKAVAGKRKVVVKRASRVNWYHGLIWPHIADAADRFDFSAARMITFLKLKDSNMFGTLNKGTIQRWKKKGEAMWTEKTDANDERGRSVKGTGRVGMLRSHPELVEKIKSKLINICGSAISVNRILARSIMLALIKAEAPTLLNKFKCCNVSYQVYIFCMSILTFHSLLCQIFLAVSWSGLFEKELVPHSTSLKMLESCVRKPQCALSVSLQSIASPETSLWAWISKGSPS